MIDGENLLHQPTQNDLRTYDNNRKIASGQGDNYTTGCLIDYPYFKEHYNLIVINLSKQQTQDADPKKYSKLILLESYMEMEIPCFSLLKKIEKAF